MLSLILLVFALVLFIVGGTVSPEPWRGRLLYLGLACWVAAELFGGRGTSPGPIGLH